jgi:hypothetical protein
MSGHHICESGESDLQSRCRARSTASNDRVLMYVWRGLLHEWHRGSTDSRWFSTTLVPGESMFGKTCSIVKQVKPERAWTPTNATCVWQKYNSPLGSNPQNMTSVQYPGHEFPLFSISKVSGIKCAPSMVATYGAPVVPSRQLPRTPRRFRLCLLSWWHTYSGTNLRGVRIWDWITPYLDPIRLFEPILGTTKANTSRLCDMRGSCLDVGKPKLTGDELMATWSRWCVAGLW